MADLLNEETVTEKYWEPLDGFWDKNQEGRVCQKLSDRQWLQMGVERCLYEHRSGRAFLQKCSMDSSEDEEIHVGHFFETLKSERRCRLIQEANTTVAAQMSAHPQEPWPVFEELNGFELYAGDGHFHKASIHELPIEGARGSPCHFYCLNLRTRAMRHLTLGQSGKDARKREHDMHALKGLDKQTLRQGAAKGKKVLYVWDSAAIDFHQCYQWKASAGIYFLCRNKDNISFDMRIEHPFDIADPINAGIISDEMVSSPTSGTPFRLVRYQCPQTETIHEFITNQMTIRPGLIAWIYKRRWDIEKTFDSFKNKLGQVRAWARSDTAKTMQATFICLTHNLTISIQNFVVINYQVQNHKEEKRAKKRAQAAMTVARANNKVFAPLYLITSIRSQIDLKFIRWLRDHIMVNSSITQATQALIRIYARF